MQKRKREFGSARVWLCPPSSRHLAPRLHPTVHAQASGLQLTVLLRIQSVSVACFQARLGTGQGPNPCQPGTLVGSSWGSGPCPCADFQVGGTQCIPARACWTSPSKVESNLPDQPQAWGKGGGAQDWTAPWRRLPSLLG